MAKKYLKKHKEKKNEKIGRRRVSDCWVNNIQHTLTVVVEPRTFILFYFFRMRKDCK